MQTILLIDRERELCKNLAEFLKPEGFQVEAAYDAKTGIEMAMNKKYSLIAVNVLRLGGDNDFSVIQHIRSETNTPILMLSARANDEERIAGFEMGADDFLQKPFNPRELIARLRAILRRMRREGEYEVLPQTPKRFQIGDIEMDLGTRVILRSGARIALTSIEFSILEIFLRNAGQIVSREELMHEALGRSLSAYDRSIDVHVSRLRKKLGPEILDMERIKTIRGEGYLYVLACAPVTDPGV
jgi:DNA-binding response OmpR family regulator